jgi:predicted methyltransferase
MNLPERRDVPVVSGRTASELVEMEPGTARVSLDLGRSVAVVSADEELITLPDGQRISRGALAEAFSEPQDCVEIADGNPRKVYIYDESRRKYYKLFQPVEGAPPTIVINGHTMHPIVGAGPWEGTADMVAALPARTGACLDTCCGLGYSAHFLAERGFEEVVTCEVDPNVLHVAAVNPWSERLFETAAIEVHLADVREYLAEAPDARFACVFHDPPSIYQAGELYARQLYSTFTRVLQAKGVLYHYVGTPGGRGGRDYAHGVMQRLQEAGFGPVRRVTGGVLAFKRRST